MPRRVLPAVCCTGVVRYHGAPFALSSSLYAVWFVPVSYQISKGLVDKQKMDPPEGYC